MHLRRLWCCLLVLFATTTVFAQQTGAFHGKVTASDGSALPGVTVEARSNALPQPRVSVTDANGDYRLPQLQPGSYTLQFTLAGMQTTTRKADALLGQDMAADVKMAVGGVSENITVTAATTLVDRDTTAIQNGMGSAQIRALPVAQNYGDLQKLIPGAMVTQDTIRGPSAGGSGQSNVYLFDGVNVTVPLFGTLASEPATHDIAQVNVIKGGAKAVDFDRAGGFLIDSVSKSGTNKFSGEVEYQVLSHSMIADQAGTVNTIFQEDRNWATASIGGPIWSDHLFFYGSYYRPTRTRGTQANLTGPLPDFKSVRNEEFGKLTFTPSSAWLINGSYRNSKNKQTSGDAFGTKASASTGSGSEADQKITTLEGSWVINPKSFGTFKFTDFKNPGIGHADHLVGSAVNTAVGTHLDIANLDQLGLLSVPTVIATNPTQSAFVQPFIDKYGYLVNGVRTGGGTTGFGIYEHNDDDFSRKNGQAGYNYTLGLGRTTHDLHVGYQQYTDGEDLFRSSNGWGNISIPGGTTTCPASACGTAKPAFFLATFYQQTGGLVPVIHSEFRSRDIELNDTIRLNDWTFNVGVIASNDTLYGQGLKTADNVAGFVKSPGTKYKMHNVPYSDTIQPRLGTTWAYNGSDTIFASIARYNPAANSDARAASWDRGLEQTLNAYFDASGTLMGVDPVKSSSGKLFQAGIKPPETQEYMIGSARQLSSRWSLRMYGRYRHADNFWEDTPNNERVCLSPFGTGGVCQASSPASNAPADVARLPYIPDLPAKLAAIGSGSTYVIANLDGAFTKYYEVTTESEFTGDKFFLRGSYTWSHYYGNFDQDNTSFNTGNDLNLFIGSSNIADAAGRNVWDNKYGDLRGDRRNIVKLYGGYTLPWQATTGAYFLYQSGQPYQIESFLPYNTITTSTSDTARYAEPAGRRRTPSYNQLDWNYTQGFALPRGLNMQLVLDWFNVMNRQQGYNYESRVGTIGTCDPTKSTSCFYTGLTGPVAYLKSAPSPNSFYAPRRFQIAARLLF
jgi:hypothetical protein